MKTKIEEFRNITEQMEDTYARKNHDYGDSFAKARKTIQNYTLGKLYDKMSRLITLMQSGEAAQVHEESIEDTLLDMANYAVMEILERRRDFEAKLMELHQLPHKGDF